jgi:hypothetical protein
MIREIKKQKILLTPIQATLFLIGLYEDTGSLTFPSVQYLIIKTKAGFKQGSMYLTRKGAPVRLVIPSARHSPSVTFTSSREA